MYEDSNNIPIKINNIINPVFIKANGFLIDKHSLKFKNKNLESKKQELKTCWKDEFNIELLTEAGQWTYMRFNNQLDAMMFLLKWK